MKILVLGGGNSSEKTVSKLSAAAVRDALTDLGHEVSYVDPAEGDAAVVEAAKAADLVMPIMHGPGDEDRLPGVLERAGVAYVGSGPAAAELCMDKPRYKELLAAHGIAVPRGRVVTAATFTDDDLTQRPFVLKPLGDGSSVGLMVAETLPYDKAQAAKLLRHYGRMLLEEHVAGVEITVAVLGERALPVVEIVPPAGQEFDFENKYNGATAEFCPPRHIDAAIQAEAQRLAEKIHRLTGCRDLSRTDMIVRPDGRLVVLETNTMPGMTAESLYPKAAAAAGLSWIQLVARLVELCQAK